MRLLINACIREKGGDDDQRVARKLAAVFSRRVREALHRFVERRASEEEVKLLGELNLRARELTKLGEACLELCRKANV